MPSKFLCPWGLNWAANANPVYFMTPCPAHQSPEAFNPGVTAVSAFPWAHAPHLKTIKVPLPFVLSLSALAFSLLLSPIFMAIPSFQLLRAKAWQLLLTLTCHIWYCHLDLRDTPGIASLSRVPLLPPCSELASHARTLAAVSWQVSLTMAVSNSKARVTLSALKKTHVSISVTKLEYLCWPSRPPDHPSSHDLWCHLLPSSFALLPAQRAPSPCRSAHKSVTRLAPSLKHCAHFVVWNLQVITARYLISLRSIYCLQRPHSHFAYLSTDSH